MEDFARVVFTIVFITILAGVIVAFGLFAIAPAEKVVKVITGGVKPGEEPTTVQEIIQAIVGDVATSTPKEVQNVPGGSTDIPPPPEPEPQLGTPENPQQSSPVAESQVPEEAVKLSVSAVGFAPSSFTVGAGTVVSLSLTSVDQTHVFYFADPKLRDVAIGVGPGETRFIEFYAPKTPGEYVFYCDVPGHRARGEEGVMVVE